MEGVEDSEDMEYACLQRVALRESNSGPQGGGGRRKKRITMSSICP